MFELRRDSNRILPCAPRRDSGWESAMAIDPAIETSDLTRYFDAICAVNGLGLHVPRGSVYAFLGPNGAGKTTTIRMVLGLTRPDRGEIRVFGESLTRANR